MADELNINDNASNVVGTLNTNFGNGSGVQELQLSDSATDFIEKLNANFAAIGQGSSGVFPAHTIVPTDIGDIKAGEDIGGMTMADFITYGINGTQRTKLRFLHVSDTHGNPNSLLMIKQMMEDDDDIDFALHTGDMKDSNDLEQTNHKLECYFRNAMRQISPFLVVPGNHDIVYSGKKQSDLADIVRSYIGDTVVVDDTVSSSHYKMDVNEYITKDNTTPYVSYGANDKSYWYKDFSFGTFKIRFIGIDQFEVGDNNSSSVGGAGTLTYTQSQMNWLAARLKEMNPNDYVVLVMHVPPLLNIAAPSDALKYNFAEDGEGNYTPTADRLFLSDRTGTTGVNQWSMDASGIEAKIIDAYLNGKAMSETVGTVINGNISLSGETFDFSQTTPCHFLFHICGHLHWDVHTYLEPYSINNVVTDYSEQLMLSIASANSPSSHYHGDLLDNNGDNLNAGPYMATGSIDGAWHARTAQGSNIAYFINDITIDFSTQRTVIKRIGARTTIDSGLLGQSRYRDAIYFPFERQQNNS